MKCIFMMIQNEGSSNEGSKKYRLAIQSVFLARENILFLKEWLIYHIEIGADHFYLYDNTGSVGRSGNSKGINKYGIPYGNITSGMSDQDVQDIMDEIREELPGRITYVKWTPRDKKGNITYGWNEALVDYVQNYERDACWTCFIDIDEFLFSVKGNSIKDIIEKVEKDGYSDILIHQKKFDERYDNLDKHVTRIEGCVEGISTTGWASKHILRPEAVDLDALINRTKGWNMHMIPIKNAKGMWMDVAELRFNHYNTNKYLLKWMKGYYKATEDFCLNGRDDGMKRYWQAIESKCKRNCCMDILQRFPIVRKMP